MRITGTFLRQLAVFGLLLWPVAAGSAPYAGVGAGQLPPIQPSVNTPQFVPGELLVGLPRGTDPSSTALRLLPVLDVLEGQGVYKVEVPPGSELALGRWLERQPGIRYAERNFLRYAMTVPNDPHYSTYQWNLRRIGAVDAWTLSVGDSGTIVAVLDSGIDTSHPDLKSKLLPGYNYLRGSTDTTDEVGHGTHIAGILGAVGNNRIGIAGVNWNCRILPLKVLGRDGSGDDFEIARAVRKAAEGGARVVNLSLGAPVYNQTLRDALDYAKARGVLVVAAAGNNYEDGNPTMYPAAYPGVMAVGATTNTDRRASYSQTGPHLSVVAPGGDPTSQIDEDPNHWIMSTWPTNRSSGYLLASGTSQAVPQVGGLASLLWAVDPSLSVDEVRETIQSTAVDLGTAGRDDTFGYGRINMAAALRKVAVSRDQTPPYLRVSAPLSGAIVHQVVAIEGSATDEHFGSYEIQYASAKSPDNWLTVEPAGTSPVTQGILGLWDTAQLDDGLYLLRLKASDGFGNLQATQPLLLTIDNTPPVIEIAAPADGASTGDTVVIKGSVVEQNGSRLYIEYGLGSDPGFFVSLPGSERRPPWSDTLGTVDLSGQPEGAYTLRVVVEDKAGNSASRTVWVSIHHPAVVVPGDIDGDGLVTVTDVVRALRLVLSSQAVSETVLQAADVAPSPGVFGRAIGDGRVGIDDAIRILRRVAGLETGVWP